MDQTTQALLFALLGAVLGAGVVLAWRVSEAQMHERAQVEEPAVPPGIATVLSVLRSSALVVDEKDEVLKASAPAYAFGLVRGNRGRGRGARRPGPAGTPRRADPRDRAGDVARAGRSRRCTSPPGWPR